MSTAEKMPDVASRQQRLFTVAVSTLVIASVAIGGFWFVAHPGDIYPRDHENSQVMTYTSVQTMAQHMGCSNTLRATQNPGSSSSAGECTYEGALVEFRIYPTEPQALAWLEGNRSQSLNSAGVYESIGIYAGKWVVVIHSTDRDLVNRAGAAVQG